MINLDQLIADLEKNDIQTFSKKYMEDKFIDFKEFPPLHVSGKKSIDDLRTEFVADVTSFANTSGGNLIYGIKEDQRIPTEFVPFEIDNMDNFITSLSQIIRSRSDSVLHAFKIIPIRNEDGKYFIIINIQRSHALHAVIDPNKKYPVYFGRTNEGSKYFYNHTQIRDTFIYRANVIDRIKLHREFRISKISVEDEILPLAYNAKIILHLIPASSFDTLELYNIEQLYNKYNNLFPISDRYTSMSRRRNVDGLLIHDYETRGRHYSYVQLNRNGIIESVDSSILEQNHPYQYKYIPGEHYEKCLISSFLRYVNAIKELEINPPIYGALTLLGVNGFKMAESNNFSPIVHGAPIDRDLLLLPIFEINDMNEFNAQAAADLLKPSFDIICNACDRPRSKNFDENGKFKIAI